MMRDASAEQFVESIEAGMRANNSEAQIAAVKTQIDQLFAMIRAVGQSKKGTRIVLDYAPSDGGTTLFVDGVAQGQPMAGEAFFQRAAAHLARRRPGAAGSQGSVARKLSGGVR